MSTKRQDRNGYPRRLQDADDRGTDAESGLGQVSEAEAAVPFSALYVALGRRLATERGAERSVLLLYLLLHGCQTFQVSDGAGRADHLHS